MGIVIKQSIKGTIWIYIGVIIGFLTTSYLYPNFLTTEQVGLTSLLVTSAQLFGSIFLLGAPGVINRLFPYFRNPENGHNGFVRIMLAFYFIGVGLMLITYFLLQPNMIQNNIESSPLLVEYLSLIVPMTIAMMLFNLLDFYNRILFNATFGIFTQDFLQKLVILALTIFYAFDFFSFDVYVISYAIVFTLKSSLILIYLFRKGELKIKPLTDVFNHNMRKEIRNVALYSITGGIGSMLIFKIDKILINHLMDLSNTGVYTIAFYFGSLISKPSQPLLKIATPIISEAWKNNDMSQIDTIYKKTCINQLIIGGFIFLGVMINMENILTILGDAYLESRWVIFFIGIGYLIELSTGANAQIISLSKLYRYNLYFIFILIVVSIGLMFLFIPQWGISGAAAAIACSFLLINILRFTFLKIKYKLQPFNYKFIVVILFFIAQYFMVALIPQMNIYVDILVRSGLVTIITAIFLSIFPISDDITLMKNKIFKIIIK